MDTKKILRSYVDISTSGLRLGFAEIQCKNLVPFNGLNIFKKFKFPFRRTYRHTC